MVAVSEILPINDKLHRFAPVSYFDPAYDTYNVTKTKNGVPIVLKFKMHYSVKYTFSYPNIFLLFKVKVRWFSNWENAINETSKF